MVVFTGSFATLISIAISAALSVASMLLFPRQSPRQPQRLLPQPPNGSINERQAIPPLRVVCGRGKVGGDLAFLETNIGYLYEIYVHAAHRIEGYVTHYLHDEIVTFDEGTGLATAPTHFIDAVLIRDRLGGDSNTAIFTGIWDFWTEDRRRSGLCRLQIRPGSERAVGQRLSARPPAADGGH
jgi:hypothetical protein